jgi:hypothetical protein
VEPPRAATDDQITVDAAHHPWLTTKQFLDQLDPNLTKVMA